MQQVQHVRGEIGEKEGKLWQESETHKDLSQN